MKTVTVVCDQCGADLSYHESSWPAEYVITLSAEVKPRPPGYTGGFVYAVPSHPPLSRTFHFCDMNCLREHPSVTGKKP